jgi:hypothetical protein
MFCPKLTLTFGSQSWVHTSLSLICTCALVPSIRFCLTVEQVAEAAKILELAHVSWPRDSKVVERSYQLEKTLLESTNETTQWVVQRVIRAIEESLVSAVDYAHFPWPLELRIDPGHEGSDLVLLSPSVDQVLVQSEDDYFYEASAILRYTKRSAGYVSEMDKLVAQDNKVNTRHAKHLTVLNFLALLMVSKAARDVAAVALYRSDTGIVIYWSKNSIVQTDQITRQQNYFQFYLKQRRDVVQPTSNNTHVVQRIPQQLQPKPQSHIKPSPTSPSSSSSDPLSLAHTPPNSAQKFVQAHTSFQHISAP